MQFVLVDDSTVMVTDIINELMMGEVHGLVEQVSIGVVDWHSEHNKHVLHGPRQGLCL